jgi:nicotinate-nucleotide pyrophosphorylase (carboxylating)
MNLIDFIRLSLDEDVGKGDFTSLACIPNGTTGRARLIIKDTGVIAGISIAEEIFKYIDPALNFYQVNEDGSFVDQGDIAFTIEGNEQSILKGERLVLNCMQRMSGIASATRLYVDQLSGLKTKVLDTRKTTPLLRSLEKLSVKLGGGHNHRHGLYDMIMIKDNHVDYAGGIVQAIRNVSEYQQKNKMNLPVEIETRNIGEVQQVLDEGKVNRIMLDNFEVSKLKEAISLIAGKYETEASGGITLNTIRAYAETGVDYISVGALTHSIKSLDMSLKAV